MILFIYKHFLRSTILAGSRGKSSNNLVHKIKRTYPFKFIYIINIQYICESACVCLNVCIKYYITVPIVYIEKVYTK